MTRQIKAHNKWLKERDILTETDKKHHKAKIEWLQHERLIHLIITIITGIIAIFLLLSVIMASQTIAAKPIGISFVIMLIVLFTYIWHYINLENTLLEWYQRYGEKRRNESH